MVWNRDSDCRFCQSLLHHNMAAALTDFFETMLYKQAAKLSS
jgi:hypothetical protein